MSARPLVLATRRSALALAQSRMVADALRERLGVEVELKEMVTTGDRQLAWSLERQGGKGLFTGELEEALLRGEADLAVHSAKDLPGDSPVGLVVAGYLPRADPRDVLVVRQGVTTPHRIGTSSPRRRQQAAPLFPEAQFAEIRGNVETRLRKVAESPDYDATFLAAAGLARLGITARDGVEFRPLEFAQMVPAVGQAAIAVQCRTDDAARFQSILDPATGEAVAVERAIQAAMGGGCQSALGVHAGQDTLWFYEARVGLRQVALSQSDRREPAATARTFLGEWDL
jgi:hydroxymethylbilane synthase